VRLSKNGRTRRIPVNSLARGAVLDVAPRRQRPGDPGECVSNAAYRTTARAFERAVEAAHATLAAAGKDTNRLDGYTWHCNRHTWASRLVMAGLGLRTLQELGGWRTLGMVERYSHLNPEHLHAAVERLVPTSSADALRYGTIPQLHRDCVTASWSVAGCVGSMRLYEHGGLASTGKAVDLKSTGPRGPWGFESLALRHSNQEVVDHRSEMFRRGGPKIVPVLCGIEFAS